jgi:putative DNA primase/helicase
MTLEQACTEACANVGIVFRAVPADGRFHLADIEGDARGKGDARIKVFEDSQGGIVYNFKSGESQTFFVQQEHSLSPDELAERKQRQKDAKEQAERERKEAYEAAARKAQTVWNDAKPCTEHAYLTRKGVLSCDGLRESEGSLVIPLRDSDGRL